METSCGGGTARHPIHALPDGAGGCGVLRLLRSPPVQGESHERASQESLSHLQSAQRRRPPREIFFGEEEKLSARRRERARPRVYFPRLVFLQFSEVTDDPEPVPLKIHLTPERPAHRLHARSDFLHEFVVTFFIFEIRLSSAYQPL